MKWSFSLLIICYSALFLAFIPSLLAQDHSQYAPSEQHPYGQVHPDAPEQMADFAPLIGRCQCSSERRNPDGTWQDPVAMTWQYKYIMNGKGIQDETWRADGTSSGSIRQFNPDSSLWYVSFYTSIAPNSSLSTWSGKKEGEDIVLNLAQKAPNGMDGFSRLTFYDISKKGFKWKGEWTDIGGTIVYPFWNIECKKEGTINFRPD